MSGSIETPDAALLAQLGERQQVVAERAFDSALVKMELHERSRLDRVDRVLGELGRKHLSEVDSASRANMTNLLWAAADPLRSKRGGEPRTEFLARVAFAELRWTVEDLLVRGADTDRGDAHIRWGPPTEMIALGPPPGNVGVSYVVTTFWWYDWGMLLAFEGPPRLAVARIAFGDDAYVAQMRDAAPVRWNNIARETIDALPVQVARFRAAGDSLDVVVVGGIPTDTIRAATDVIGPVRADFWLVGGGEGGERRDSLVRVGEGSATVVTFRAHVPRRDYLYRMEATADGSLRAAQVTGMLVADGADGFPGTGFGISDLLLASSVSGPPAPDRWSDLAVTPIVTSVGRGRSLVLVWENYEFASRDGRAEYSIEVTIAPERRSGIRVALQALGAVGRALGAGDDGARRVVFDRARAHAAVLTEYVSIGLDGTPPGGYRLTVRVTDKPTGQVLERTISFEIG